MAKLKYKGSVKDCLIFYLKLSSIVDPKSELSPTEANILAEFLALPEKFKYMRFSLQGKKKVAETLGVSKVSVNNKLYSLIAKGFLMRDEDGIIYAQPYLSKFVDLLAVDKTATIEVILDGSN